jgi:hypothetical protein
VLYEAATGERPVAGGVVQGRRLPRTVRAAIEGALAPEPRERPTLDEVESALDALVD